MGWNGRCQAGLSESMWTVDWKWMREAAHGWEWI